MQFRKRLFDALRNCLPNLTFIWLAIIVYNFNSYYSSFLRAQTQSLLFWLAACYTIMALPLLVVFPIKDDKGSKGYIVFMALLRLFKQVRHYLRNFTVKHDEKIPHLEQHEKVSLLFMIIKIYFLPIMVDFFFSNYFDILAHWHSFTVSFHHPTFDTAIDSWYKMGLAVIFGIDTLFFSFGYAVEWSFLKSKVKSVEPTMLGWMVALLCYPPFNDVSNRFLGWYPNDMSAFSTREATAVIRIGILLLLFVYVWATVALGAKCSNLTNRGIVTRGPYRIVRHPAYAGKVLSWWLTLIPVLSPLAFCSMLGWSVIYYLRAITEERHLILDDDYKEYCKKVKYRFIPGVW